jgi:hypothetical protein
MSSVVPIETPQYRLVSPEGRQIALTKEIFDSIEEMQRRRCTGSVIIDFKGGGIAGVESQTKKVYK